MNNKTMWGAALVLLGLLTVSVSAHAQAQPGPWNPGGGLNGGGAAGAVLKSAPVFDPVIHQQAKTNTPLVITIGATDTDGDAMILNAAGPAVQNSVQIINQQGRAEMRITLNSAIAVQQSPVNLTATDATGLVTKYTMRVKFVAVVNDLPTVLSAIEHQTIRLGETLRLNVDAYDPDPAALGMQAIFPNNNGVGVLNITSSKPGYVSSRLQWKPIKAGVYDIAVKATNLAGAAVVGSNVDGFIRVTVKNPAGPAGAVAPNAPAVFEALETKQILIPNPPAIQVSANDMDNDLITLSATGASVANVLQIVNIPGHATAVITLQNIAANAPSYQIISLTAVDQKGNVTVIDLPVDFKTAVNNQPTTLSPLPTQAAQVNQPFTFDISASDVDPEDIDLNVASPFGNGQFIVNNAAPGFVSGTFTWTPQAPGVYHIPVFTNDLPAGRNNAAYGILEVNVQ